MGGGGGQHLVISSEKMSSSKNRVSHRHNCTLLDISDITGYFWTLLDITGKIQIYFAYNSVKLNYGIPNNVQKCPVMSSLKI